MKANQSIRNAAKIHGVKHWQIAIHLGVSEQTFMRWLRLPLSQEKENTVMEAIEAIAKEGR